MRLYPSGGFSFQRSRGEGLRYVTLGSFLLNSFVFSDITIFVQTYTSQTHLESIFISPKTSSPIMRRMVFINEPSFDCLDVNIGKTEHQLALGVNEHVLELGE